MKIYKNKYKQIDIIAYKNGDKIRSRSRIRDVPPKISPIKEYSKDTVNNVRIGLNLSQRAFAEILGVSQKTVEAWKARANRPPGSSSRIVELLEKDSKLLEHYNVLVKS